MESKTLNQIFDGFEQFAINHPQIQSYDLGTELQLDLKKTEQFTKMFVLVGPATWGNPSVAPSFDIKIVDKVLTDKETNKWHINEILSDTMQICTDFVHFLKVNRLIAQGVTVTFNPQVYDQDNQLAGWSFNVTLSTEMVVTSCYVDGFPDTTGLTINLLKDSQEYLEAPAVQLLPDSTDDLDLAFIFSGATTGELTVFVFGELLGPDSFSLFLNTNNINLNLTKDGSAEFNASTSIPLTNSGTITVKGSTSLIEVAIDGNVLISQAGTFDLTNLHAFKSQYGAFLSFPTQTYSGFQDAKLNKVKVQDNNWIFPEGSGGITASDTEIDMTLNTLSDLAVVSGEHYMEIQISPETGKVLDVDQIDFEVETIPVPGFMVRAFDLVYSKDPTFATFTREMVRIDVSSGSVVVNHVFDSVINVIDSETLYIRWYPYNSDDDTGAPFVLNNADVIVSGEVDSVPGNIIQWNTSSDTSSFTFNAADIIAPVYALGSDVFQVGSDGNWRRFPLPIFDYTNMWDQS